MSQNIAWQHGPLEQGEDEHEGILDNQIIVVNGTYGFHDKWNISMDLTLGQRRMDFFSAANIHHRDESQKGLGDIRLSVRYLQENVTFGPGARVFWGASIVLPSENTLQENPFKLAAENTDHTHFDMSEGVLKLGSEIQYFYRSTSALYPGGVLRLDIPMKENQYGFISGKQLLGTVLLYWQSQEIFKMLPFLTLTGITRTPDYWDGVKAPNSGGTYIDIGAGLNKSKGDYVFSISGNTLISYTANVAGGNIDEVDSAVNIWGISISVRRKIQLSYNS